MPISSGRHTLGPGNATLTVKTGKTGAAAKAGHNLVFEVSAWTGTLEVGEDPAQTRIELSADSGSLRVLEGSGGVQALDADDKDAIKQTIDDEVLRGAAIEFRSHRAELGPETLGVDGELSLGAASHPVAFELALGADGRLAGSAKFKQTDFGMKPYSTLFGTLKVADEVEVVIDAKLASS
ncbi:MAG: YceI family protein [Actinomycetota bacterium]|nr:YceI family protein [Actinomycetota bacterium]